jgi:hypothetical protein
VSLTTVNLHPAQYMGILSAFGMAFLQVYLVMLIHSIGVYKLHESLQGFGFLKRQLLGIMGLHRIFGALVLAFWPPLILLCLGAGDVVSGSNFFILWAYIWLCMCVFGAICHHLYDIFGPG